MGNVSIDCYIGYMEKLAIPTILVVALSIPLWIAFTVGEGDVHRRRVERFAARHGLEITVDNGTQVIRYLATTRRWRAYGLAAGLALSVAWSLPNLNVNSLYLLAGWFVGAVIAEMRVAHLPHGASRVALVTPRRLATYLPAFGRELVPASAGICLAVGLVTQALLWTIVGLAVAVLVGFVQRRILQRPQPVAGPDELAADDAIRSRSLHVLAGGGGALVLYCVMGQLDMPLVTLFGVFLVPLVGIIVATSPWRVVRVH